MKGTKTSMLSSEDVCHIIEASAKNGVYSIKFGELEIQFGKPAESRPENTISEEDPRQPPQNVSTPLGPDTKISEEQHNINNEEALRQNEAELRQEQIDNLLLEDPLAAEEMIRNGDLEDVDEPTTDDE